MYIAQSLVRFLNPVKRLLAFQARNLFIKRAEFCGRNIPRHQTRFLGKSFLIRMNPAQFIDPKDKNGCVTVV